MSFIQVIALMMAVAVVVMIAFFFWGTQGWRRGH